MNTALVLAVYVVFQMKVTIFCCLDIRIISASIFHIFETLFRIDGGKLTFSGLQTASWLYFEQVCMWGGGRCLGEGSQGDQEWCQHWPICCPRNAYASWPSQALSFDNNQKPIISAWEFLVQPRSQGFSRPSQIQWEKPWELGCFWFRQLKD